MSVSIRLSLDTLMRAQLARPQQPSVVVNKMKHGRGVHAYWRRFRRRSK